GVFPVHRVIVTNTLTAASLGDLQVTLTHGGFSVVLNRYSTNGPILSKDFLFDDSSEGDIPDAQKSAGPGSLADFSGADGAGQWMLTLTDTNHAATNESFWIFLERQPDLSAGDTLTILPGACRNDFLYLPPATTNVTGSLTFVSGTGPISFQICPVEESETNCLVLPVSVPGTNALISLDQTSHPPLNPGSCVVRVCNLGPDPGVVNLLATSQLDINPPAPTRIGITPRSPIADDAVSFSTLTVTNRERILSLEVGVRLDHPRISDLALHLIGPDGTNVLLHHNRAPALPGLGGREIMTNTVPVSSSGGAQTATNVVDTGQTAGKIGINYDFFSLPDDMRIYYDGNLLFDSGLVNGAGSTNLSFGPGLST